MVSRETFPATNDFFPSLKTIFFVKINDKTVVKVKELSNGLPS